MSYSVTLIPGDGIGPEVTPSMRRCIDALGLEIKWGIALAGKPALEKFGMLLPPQTLNSIKKSSYKRK